MISFKNVKKSYGEEIVFSNLNFNIEYGQKVVLTGKSGNGKTTLLNMIPGFEKKDSGIIKIHGLLLNEKNVWNIRAKTSLIFQYPVFEKASVFENILFPFSFKFNRNLKPTEEILKKNMHLLGLDSNILSKKSNELSGGQNQRIALMICKLLKRELVLLDEPTSALDPDSKKQAMQYILDDPETTVLSISHDSEWIKNCDYEIQIQELNS